MSSPVTSLAETNPEMPRSLASDLSFQKAMPSTAAAMREAESAVPALGVLTVLLSLAYVVSLVANHWFGCGTLDVAGYGAMFTACMAVVVLCTRSVLAYAILSFNAVFHETLRVVPIPVLSVKPLPHQAGFYASVMDGAEPDDT